MTELSPQKKKNRKPAYVSLLVSNIIPALRDANQLSFSRGTFSWAFISMLLSQQCNTQHVYLVNTNMIYSAALIIEELINAV